MRVRVGDLAPRQKFRTIANGIRGIVIEFRTTADGPDGKIHAPRVMLPGLHASGSEKTLHPNVIVEIEG